MKADPKVIQGLQQACGLLATLAEQYRLNGYALRNLGLKKLGKKFYDEDSWHQAIEHHLNIFIKQILNFEADPQYSIGGLVCATDLKSLISTSCNVALSAFTTLCRLRSEAFAIRADAVPDEYEHAVQELQHQVNRMERWLRNISAIGPNDFVGAFLEE